jgi:tetratricopeptide (TPR) repeat protein
MSYLIKIVIASLLSGVFYSVGLAAEADLHAAREEALFLYKDGRADEASVAFDNLSRQSPADDSLKVWKALAMLEQARQMREATAPGYKPLVVEAYAVLKPLTHRMGTNPDWCYAMAKAYWLNDRPGKARKAIKKALYFRQNFPEAYILLGDLAYEDGLSAPSPSLNSPGNPVEEEASKAAALYDLALMKANLPPEIAAEASYKLGLVELVLRGKKDKAREWWEKAVASAPRSYYGKRAQGKLDTVRGGTPRSGISPFPRASISVFPFSTPRCSLAPLGSS